MSIAPERIWVIVEELEPKVWFEDNEHIEDLATEYVHASTISERERSLCASLSSEKARADAAEEERDEWKQSALDVATTLGGLKDVGERLTTAESRATAAEERARVALIANSELGEQNASLRASVEELKKKAGRLARMRDTELRIIRGYIRPDFNSHPVDAVMIMDARIKAILSELSEMRRNTVRVDVLLRWMERSARKVRAVTGDVREAEVAVVLMRWLPLVLSRRSHEGKKEEGR